MLSRVTATAGMWSLCRAFTAAAFQTGCDGSGVSRAAGDWHGNGISESSAAAAKSEEPPGPVWCSRCMGDELPHQIATPAEECKQLELLRTNVAPARAQVEGFQRDVADLRAAIESALHTIRKQSRIKVGRT
jgi:hypothetical protein